MLHFFCHCFNRQLWTCKRYSPLEFGNSNIVLGFLKTKNVKNTPLTLIFLILKLVFTHNDQLDVFHQGPNWQFLISTCSKCSILKSFVIKLYNMLIKFTAYRANKSVKVSPLSNTQASIKMLSLRITCKKEMLISKISMNHICYISGWRKVLLRFSISSLIWKSTNWLSFYSIGEVISWVHL